VPFVVPKPEETPLEQWMKNQSRELSPGNGMWYAYYLSNTPLEGDTDIRNHF